MFNNLFFHSNYAEFQRDTQYLIEAFRKLPPRLAKKHMTAAMRRAIKPFEPALRDATPYRTGSLRRSIKTITRFYNKADHGAVAAVVGYARGTLKKKRGQFVISGSGQHGIIVEKGTTDRKTSSGRRCGRMPARYMMQSTLNANKSAILSNIETQLAVSLERAAKELAKNPVRGF